MTNAEVIRFEIAKLVLKPGDVIVMKVDRFPAMEEIASTKDVFNRWFPDNKLMVLVPGVELSVISEAKP